MVVKLEKKQVQELEKSEPVAEAPAEQKVEA